MALPATDTFTGTAGADLSASWSWETNGGNNKMVLDGSGNAKCNSTSVDDCRHYWTADTFGNDHYTEIVTGFTGPGNGTAYIEIMVRASGNFTGANDTRYVFQSDGGSDTFISVKNNNVSGGAIWTGNTFTFNSGDTIRFSVTGSTNPVLSVYKNGTLFASTTDTSAQKITSGGAPGVGGYDGGIGVVKIASWTGDNVSSATANTRDTVTRFRLRSATAFRDTVFRFKLATAGTFRDTATRFRLKSATTFRDTVVRLRVQSIAQWRDTATRFKLQAQATRDTATRFRLTTSSFRDTATRFRLISPTTLRDTAIRFRLQSTTLLRDTSTRFRLLAVATRDTSARFRLQSAAAIRDTALRFRLAGQSTRDTATRLRLRASTTRDTSIRFALQLANANTRDTLTRFRLASSAVLRDTATRVRLQSATRLRDTAARYRLAAGAPRDTATRFNLLVPGLVIRDTATRVRLASQTRQRDTALRFRIQRAGLRDTAVRFALIAHQTRDCSLRFKLSTPGGPVLVAAHAVSDSVRFSHTVSDAA